MSARTKYKIILNLIIEPRMPNRISHNGRLPPPPPSPPRQCRYVYTSLQHRDHKSGRVMIIVTAAAR